MILWAPHTIFLLSHVFLCNYSAGCSTKIYLLGKGLLIAFIGKTVYCMKSNAFCDRYFLLGELTQNQK